MRRTRVDLHTHTSCSDGRLSPSELVERAAETGLAGLAVTDHDTVDAWSEAARAAEHYDLELIPGVELTVFLNGRSIHLLAYFFDPHDRALAQFLADDRVRRERRAEAIVARLNGLGVPLTMNSVLEEADGGSICRPHIARALMKAGHVSSYREAFARYIGDEQPAYVNVLGAGPEEAIRIVREAGGITSVAHPGQYITEDMLEQLVDAGIDGIEAIHPSHDTLMTEQYRRIAEAKDLIITGGSDYHGYRDLEEERLGYYALSERQMRRVRSRAASFADD